MSRFFSPSLCAALAAAAVATAPAVAHAQLGTATPITDSELARAQRLVSAGQGMRGRALVDSVLQVTPTDSPRFAEALFTRASIAATASAAERDYRRIFIEYPLSPRAPEALMRLAQLEIARGDRALATKHLERLTRQHPGSHVIPRASYWLARVHFEQGDAPQACEALAVARSGVPASDVELRNQIEYYAGRCSSGGMTVTATGAAAAGTEAGAGAGAESVAAEGREGGPPTENLPPEAASSGTIPSPTEPDRPTRDGASRSSSTFSVQVAAYRERRAAERLATKLQGRGHAARVVGRVAPYRVRVGRYETRAAAALAVRTLEAQSIDGIVVESEPR